MPIVWRRSILHIIFSVCLGRGHFAREASLKCNEHELAGLDSKVSKMSEQGLLLNTHKTDFDTA